MYIISVSQAYFGSISIYRSPVLSASLPSQVATLRNNRVVRRVCKDLSVQFHKGLLGFSLICHILQSGAAVFTASSLRNNNKSFILTWRCMYHVCIRCIRCFNASNSFSSLARCCFCQASTKNWELPAQAHFWFGLKCPLHLRFKHRLWKASHVIRSDNSELQVPTAKKKKLVKSLHSDRFWATCVCGRAWIILVELLGCPWYLVNYL